MCAVACVAALLMLGVVFAAVPAGATAQGPAALEITTQPALSPDFDEAISDYVVRCEPSNEAPVTVSSPPGTRVGVDGQPPSGGSYSQQVKVAPGESFEIAVARGQAMNTHVVRCLPSDFPDFTATRSGTPQAAFYGVSPSLSGNPPPTVSPDYVAFFDNYGVPVWWMRSIGNPIDFKLLPNRNVSWTHFLRTEAPEERRLDGTLVRRPDTVGFSADSHDLQLMDNGNYLLGTYINQTGVDMSACGGSTSHAFIDFELQEVTPAGALVWSWRASDHIPISEVTANWASLCTAPNGNGDVYHWNSAEEDGDGYVLSFRHLDAVYRIDRATGAIDWKLGGKPSAESLTVVGDPVSPGDVPAGQHDARILPDGTLTIHDNGTGRSRAPRGVRYAIDETARTATWLEEVSDAGAAASPCCGSARRLPGGNWVSSWGGNPLVTELTSAGERVFTLSFAYGLFSHRAAPILPGELSRAALREGMNAQHPRQPPPDTKIDDGPSGTIGTDAATFGFSGSPEANTAKLECKLDAGTFSECTSPKTFGSLSDGTHTVGFRAIDAVGKEDPSPVSRTFAVDTVAPDTKITKQPKGKVKTKKSKAKVKVAFTSEPGSTFKCKLDRARFRPCSSPLKRRPSRSPERARSTRSRLGRPTGPATSAGRPP